MSHFPQTLKHWRKTRRFSQLELALEANVSARHISFLETGRAKPSREMVSRIGEALKLSLASRNQLYSHAGFTPAYKCEAWDAAKMVPVRRAVDYMLKSHNPYPAFAVDRLWNVVQINDTAGQLFSGVGMKVGSSLIDLVTSDLMPTLIENWQEVAQHSAQRLRTESAAQGGAPELDQAAEHLESFGRPDEISANPVIPTIYRFGDMRLSLFATIAQFGTPHDIGLDDMKIEMFFPADEQTDTLLKQMNRE